VPSRALCVRNDLKPPFEATVPSKQLLEPAFKAPVRSKWFLERALEGSG
jgi:hypothetical protein